MTRRRPPPISDDVLDQAEALRTRQVARLRAEGLELRGAAIVCTRCEAVVLHAAPAVHGARGPVAVGRSLASIAAEHRLDGRCRGGRLRGSTSPAVLAVATPRVTSAPGAPDADQLRRRRQVAVRLLEAEAPRVTSAPGAPDADQLRRRRQAAVRMLGGRSKS